MYVLTYIQIHSGFDLKNRTSHPNLIRVHVAEWTRHINLVFQIIIQICAVMEKDSSRHRDNEVTLASCWVSANVGHDVGRLRIVSLPSGQDQCTKHGAPPVTVSCAKDAHLQHHHQNPHPSGRLHSKQNTNVKLVLVGTQRKQDSSALPVECEPTQLLWETIWRVFKQLSTELPCEWAIPRGGIYPKHWKQGLEQIFIHQWP